MFKSERFDSCNAKSQTATIIYIFSRYDEGQSTRVVVERDSYIQWWHLYVLSGGTLQYVESCHVLIVEASWREVVE